MLQSATGQPAEAKEQRSDLDASDATETRSPEEHRLKVAGVARGRPVEGFQDAVGLECLAGGYPCPTVVGGWAGTVVEKRQIQTASRIRGIGVRRPVHWRQGAVGRCQTGEQAHERIADLELDRCAALAALAEKTKPIEAAGKLLRGPRMVVKGAGK